MKKYFTILLFAVSLVFSFSSVSAQGYLMLAGGGSESSAGNSWSSGPYGWFVDKAEDQPVVVLSNSDTSNWLPNYFLSLGASEVINLTIQHNSETEIAGALEGAGAVFFKGGDQRHYIDNWKDTEIETLVRAVFESGGAIGGTSAGAMIAGEFFTRGGTTSDQLLRNPYAGQNTMQTGFLNLIPGTIVDTHYFERGRPGRLISKMAWIAAEMEAESVTGIGIDDKTAVMISPDGTMRVGGTGGVHLLRSDDQTQFEAMPNADLSVKNLIAHQLTHGFEIDLATGAITAQPDDAFTVDPMPDFQLDAGIHMRRNGWTSLYLNGKSSDTSRIILDSGETGTNAIEQDEVPVEVIPHNPGMIDDEDWIASLFASDRLFVNISTEEWLALSSSEVFRSALGQSASEVELLMRHLPVMTDAYATNLSAGEFIAYDGLIQTRSGSGILQHVVSVDSTYLNQNQFENRASAPGWLMHKHQSHIALSGTRFSELSYEQGELRFGNQLMPAIVMDAREGYITAKSPFVASGSSNQTRNSAAVSTSRLHVMPAGSTFQLYDGEPVSLDPRDNHTERPERGFTIESAYPNPFNPATTLSIIASEPAGARVEVFNMLGQQIFELPALQLREGRNQVSINLEGQSTGIYLVRVSSGSDVQTLRVTLVK